MSEPTNLHAELASFLAPYDQLKAVEELAEAGAPVPTTEARQILARVKDWWPEEITVRNGEKQKALRSPGEWRGDVFHFTNSTDFAPDLVRPLTLSRRAYLACLKADAIATELEAQAAAVLSEAKVPELGGRRPGAEATLYRLAERLCLKGGKVPYRLPSMLAAEYKEATGNRINVKDPLLQKVTQHFKTCGWKPPAQTVPECRPNALRTVV